MLLNNYFKYETNHFRQKMFIWNDLMFLFIRKITFLYIFLWFLNLDLNSYVVIFDF